MLDKKKVKISVLSICDKRTTHFAYYETLVIL